MVAVAASAVLSALLAAFRVPPNPGAAYGTVGCLAVVGLTYLAKDTRDLVSALAAVACGILVGTPLVQDPCSPVGIFVGPFLGSLVRAMSRPRSRTSTRDPGPVRIPGISVTPNSPVEP